MAIELVVGLGNPGADYAGTRHNVGFRVVEELARRDDAGWRPGPLCELSPRARRSHHLAKRRREIRRPDDIVWLARPLTFMNRSGAAVQALLADLDIEIDNTLLVVDDVDLPLGRLRLRAGGGPGTHNGLRDTCSRLGESFPRLRMGVRGAEHDWQDLADYVLSPFAGHEETTAAEMVNRAADAVEAAIIDGVQAAMGVFNRKPAPPPE